MVKKLKPTESQQIAAQLWTQNAADHFPATSKLNGQDLVNKQDKLSQHVPQKIKVELDAITDSIRSNLSQVNITQLNPEVGGRYSKEGIELNQNQLDFSLIGSQNIEQHIQETSARINHIISHELQHKEHNDHLPLKFSGQTPQLHLGGIVLTPNEVVEGANMLVTGTHSETNQQVVSLQYMQIYKKFKQAVQRSNHSSDEILQAIQQRDLTQIDDRNISQIAS